GLHLQRSLEKASSRQRGCYQPRRLNFSTESQLEAGELERMPETRKRMLISPTGEPCIRELRARHHLPTRFSFLCFHTKQGTTDTRDLGQGLPTQSGQENAGSAQARHCIVIPAQGGRHGRATMPLVTSSGAGLKGGIKHRHPVPPLDHGVCDSSARQPSANDKHVFTRKPGNRFSHPRPEHCSRHLPLPTETGDSLNQKTGSRQISSHLTSTAPRGCRRPLVGNTYQLAEKLTRPHGGIAVRGKTIEKESI